METVFGETLDTWNRIMNGDSIDDNQRVERFGPARRAARLARRVALQNVAAGLDAGAAVVVATSKGAIEEWLRPPPVPTSDNPTGGLHAAGLGDIAGEIRSLVGGCGPTLTVSAACASGLIALVRGAMMIRSGEVRQALIVATEASVHPLFIGSFRRLGVLAKPGEGCRPFDRNRAGFYMSEAACAVLLQACDGEDRVPGPVIIERFALGGDATHLTGADPDGRLLKHLLARVVDDRPVDLIHAHGTGTEMNDATELSAIEATICDGPKRPVVYSHKAALGHSLGTSGLLSVVLNCQAHTTGRIPPNPRTTDPLPAGRVLIPHKPTERAVRRSLAIAAGFGGATAVVSLTSR